jgi:ATP-binding cassette subfamily C protein CydD
VLPPGTIREVLTSARPGTGSIAEQDLTDAIRACGLQDVIADHGIDAPLGRSGRGLSLGERQRLCLARALLSPTPVVILDEPTAHLDEATEQLVIDLLATLRSQGRAVLVLAHRSRLLEAADDVAEVHAETRAREVTA